MQKDGSLLGRHRPKSGQVPKNLKQGRPEVNVDPTVNFFGLIMLFSGWLEISWSARKKYFSKKQIVPEYFNNKFSNTVLPPDS